MSWNCASCGRLVTSNPTICDGCGAAAAGADPNYVNLALQRDRVMEGHLMALALWHRIGAILIGVLAVIMLIGGGAMFGMGRHSGLGGAMGGVMAFIAIVLVIAGGFSYVLGHFIARYASWARITAGVFAAIGLAMNAISTVMGLVMISSMNDRMSMYGSSYSYSSGPSAAGLLIRGLISIAWAASITWVFFNRRSAQITTPQYKELVAQTPEIRPATYKSPFFLIPLVLIGIAVLLVLFGAVMMAGRSSF